MEIYNSDSIGGRRILAACKDYSTNEEDKYNYSDLDGNEEFITLVDLDIWSSRPYFNDKFTNLSDVTMDVRINVYMD